jgi:hypothetical protein
MHATNRLVEPDPPFILKKLPLRYLDSRGISERANLKLSSSGAYPCARVTGPLLLQPY